MPGQIASSYVYPEEQEVDMLQRVPAWACEMDVCAEMNVCAE